MWFIDLTSQVAAVGQMGSLSNRAPLVNNLFSLALYAGIRVVSAVGMTPPHDERSRVRPPTVSCAVQIGRNEPTGMTSPTSWQTSWFGERRA
jgi:hypothetical protein